MTLVEIAEMGIDALAQGDPIRLEHLITAAQAWTEPNGGEPLVLRERLRTFELLLALTRRNVRLLQLSPRGGAESRIGY